MPTLSYLRLQTRFAHSAAVGNGAPLRADDVVAMAGRSRSRLTSRKTSAEVALFTHHKDERELVTA